MSSKRAAVGGFQGLAQSWAIQGKARAAGLQQSLPHSHTSAAAMIRPLVLARSLVRNLATERCAERTLVLTFVGTC
jgi:hypothetical protein